MRIAFMGDVIPGGVLYEELLRNGFHLFPRKTQTFLDEFDLRVCNLECPICDYDENTRKREKHLLRAPTKSIKALKLAGMDIVSLANNHIFDYGVEGFQSTVSLLRENGIGFIGAGMSLDEARAPYLVLSEGVKIGFLAYGALLEESTPAKHNSPGIAPMYWDIIEEDVARLRADYDHLVLFLHWGREYTFLPPIENVHKARSLLEAGVDLIVGSHSHCVQGWIAHYGKQTFFSLGNFLFPDYYATVSKSKQLVTMVYPNTDTKSPDVRRSEWPLASRVSILLDVRFRKTDYALEYFPVCQARGSNKTFVLHGWRRALIRQFLNILSSSYVIANYPGIYNVLRMIQKTAWLAMSLIFRKQLRRVLALLIKALSNPILIRRAVRKIWRHLHA